MLEGILELKVSQIGRVYSASCDCVGEVCCPLKDFESLGGICACRRFIIMSKVFPSGENILFFDWQKLHILLLRIHNKTTLVRVLLSSTSSCEAYFSLLKEVRYRTASKETELKRKLLDKIINIMGEKNDNKAIFSYG